MLFLTWLSWLHMLIDPGRGAFQLENPQVTYAGDTPSAARGFF